MSKKGTLPAGVKLAAFMANGKTPRCQRVKAIGKQCEKSAMVGRPFCRNHGGKSGRPSVTGEHSKYNPVPKGLRANFEKAKNDPEILNLTNKIALLDSAIWKACESAQNQETFTPVQFKKLLAIIKSHRELVAQETDRRVSMGSLLSVEQVMQIISFVYASINRNVSDPTARIRIANDLRSIVQPAEPALLDGVVSSVTE